jgi:hypothetical protein
MDQARIKLALICGTFGTALLLSATLTYAASIREVKGTNRSLIPIQTALGFSTILEFQSKPLSAVLGDQDGFKLEYVANSITLKPLIAGAKSNLFVFTDSGRYNFSIQAGTSSSVDYIVTIKPPEDSSQSSGIAHKETDPYRVVTVNRKASAQGFTLQVNQLKIARELNNPRTASLIEFEISSANENYPFQVSSFGIKQNGKFISAESIYLDQLSVKPGQSVRGVIAVLNQEWKSSSPIFVIFAVSKLNSKTKKQETYRIEVSANPQNHPFKKKGEKNGEIDLFPKAH